jgi:ABC-type multidrug transport system fused ATPase/permease subunit
MRYRPNTDVVLSKVSFKIESGMKVGVVGRTGAGKSSLGITMSRIVELLEGCIEIDGVDISKVELKNLRQKVTVIS